MASFNCPFLHVRVTPVVSVQKFHENNVLSILFTRYLYSTVLDTDLQKQFIQTFEGLQPILPIVQPSNRRPMLLIDYVFFHLHYFAPPFNKYSTSACREISSNLATGTFVLRGKIETFTSRNSDIACFPREVNKMESADYKCYCHHWSSKRDQVSKSINVFRYTIFSLLKYEIYHGVFKMYIYKWFELSRISNPYVLVYYIKISLISVRVWFLWLQVHSLARNRANIISLFELLAYTFYPFIFLCNSWSHVKTTGLRSIKLSSIIP